MSDITNKNNSNLRFFSDSSVFKNNDGAEVKKTDPNPFGLDFQENYPKSQINENKLTMSQCPTNTPGGSDNCIDIDYDF